VCADAVLPGSGGGGSWLGGRPAPPPRNERDAFSVLLRADARGAAGAAAADAAGATRPFPHALHLELPPGGNGRSGREWISAFRTVLRRTKASAPTPGGAASALLSGALQALGLGAGGSGGAAGGSPSTTSGSAAPPSRAAAAAAAALAFMGPRTGAGSGGGGGDGSVHGGTWNAAASAGRGSVLSLSSNSGAATPVRARSPDIMLPASRGGVSSPVAPPAGAQRSAGGTPESAAAAGAQPIRRVLLLETEAAAAAPAAPAAAVAAH
jgi:hypothetical protein